MPGPRSDVSEVDGRVDEPPSALDAIVNIEAVLEHVLGARMRDARSTDPVFARDVAGRVSVLVQRGGKRLRTAFAWCGWRAAGGKGDSSAVLHTGAALELVQACALIHDDVMDGSPLRRGAPAVHVDLARMHRNARMSGSSKTFAASAAVLAGDLALAWADDLLTDTALGSPHGRLLHEEWRSMREEMVAGQYRDIHAEAARSTVSEEALTVATLKSALYTVARPLALGASLAGADEHTLEALRSAGRCVGLAFQLRDELLGAFGDPARTGKPVGEDLSSHKLTYLLATALERAEAQGDEEASAVLGPCSASGNRHTVERIRNALERTGARDVVEAKIAELSANGLRHFETAGASPAVQREFAAMVDQASGLTPRHTEEVA
ncbi:polyprenyl synthetase family protein [Streptomyces sp. NPDC005047]